MNLENFEGASGYLCILLKIKQTFAKFLRSNLVITLTHRHHALTLWKLNFDAQNLLQTFAYESIHFKIKCVVCFSTLLEVSDPMHKCFIYKSLKICIGMWFQCWESNTKSFLSLIFFEIPKPALFDVIFERNNKGSLLEITWI